MIASYGTGKDTHSLLNKLKTFAARCRYWSYFAWRYVWEPPIPRGAPVEVLPPKGYKHWSRRHETFVIEHYERIPRNYDLPNGFIYHLKTHDGKTITFNEEWVVPALSTAQIPVATTRVATTMNGYTKSSCWINNLKVCWIAEDGTVTFAETVTTKQLKTVVEALLQERERARHRRFCDLELATREQAMDDLAHEDQEMGLYELKTKAP